VAGRPALVDRQSGRATRHPAGDADAAAILALALQPDFLEKPFENWTRRSAELLGTVFLYFDCHLPLEGLRAELSRVLAAHPPWDKRVEKLQLTEARENSIQLRALMSAADPDALWTLRCDVREALVRFVRERYPSCLVRTRVMMDGPPNSDATER